MQMMEHGGRGYIVSRNLPTSAPWSTTSKQQILTLPRKIEDLRFPWALGLDEDGAGGRTIIWSFVLVRL